MEYLTPCELLNENLRYQKPKIRKQKCLDLYFERSEFNNLPKSISCNNDIRLGQRLLKNIFIVPQLLTLFHLTDYFFIVFTIGLTVLWDVLDITYQPDIGTIITLILFPLTYALGNSFYRRQEMLNVIANLRASSINLILSTANVNHQVATETVSSNRGPNPFSSVGPAPDLDTLQPTTDLQSNREQIDLEQPHLESVRLLSPEIVNDLTITVHRDLSKLLRGYVHYAESTVEEERHEWLHYVYAYLTRLHWAIYFLSKGQGDAIIERMSGNFQDITSAFEGFRSFIDYGASTSLGYFLRALILCNTVFLTPLFAGYIKTSNGAHVLAYSLTSSIIISIVALFRIQTRLENPVGKDWDDLNLRSLLQRDFFFQLLKIRGSDPNISRLRLGRANYQNPVHLSDTLCSRTNNQQLPPPEFGENGFLGSTVIHLPNLETSTTTVQTPPFTQTPGPIRGDIGTAFV